MATSETAPETDFVQLTDAEFDAYLDREVRRETSLETFAEFRRAFQAGRLDLDDPGVERIVPLLQLDRG